MVHEYPCRVRWSDVDAYGHVNNVTFFEYIQEARIALLHELLGEFRVTGETTVVAQQDVDYLAPMSFRTTPYRLLTWVSRIGRSSYELVTEIRDERTRFARSRTVLVAYDSRTGRSRPLGEAERSALESALSRG